MAACAWPWGRRLRWAPLLWVAIALLARFACARSVALKQAPIEEGTAEQRRPQQPTVNEVWDSSDARVDAARRVGDLTAHHRRLQQPKIDEARDASDTGTSAADGKSAGGAAAVEDPLTLSLSDSSGNKLFRRAGELGVFHYGFPGVIKLAEGAFEAVVVYVYIKGLRQGDTVTFRGFMFAQSTERAWYNWGETGLCMPHVTDAWTPRVYFREVYGKQEYDFRVYKELMWGEEADLPAPGTNDVYRVCTPFPFEANLTLAAAQRDMELHLDNFEAFVYFSPGSVELPVEKAAVPAGGLPPPEVVALLSPFMYPTPHAIANNMLFLYIKYHMVLGITKYIQYTQSTFIGGFLSDPRLVRLHDKGVLEFVLWESTIECGKGARLKCWQPVLYSHAILAAWGTKPNLYLAFADHDEYLAIPYPDSIPTVQDIITMCSAGQTQVNLRRYNAFCGPERCSSKDNMTDMRAAGEIDVWTGASPDGPHPLSHYTLRSARTWQHDKGKCIVHVDHMAGYQVHYGMVLPSGYTHPQAIGPFGAPVSENCGSWLHLSNMFIARTDRAKMVADAAGWHWIFPKIDAFWKQPEWADVLAQKPAAARGRTRRRGVPQDLEKALSLANVNVGR